jgi:hypothetical protein
MYGRCGWTGFSAPAPPKLFGGPLGGASGDALKFCSYCCSRAFDIYMLTCILDTDYIFDNLKLNSGPLNSLVSSFLVCFLFRVEII